MGTLSKWRRTTRHQGRMHLKLQEWEVICFETQEMCLEFPLKRLRNRRYKRQKGQMRIGLNWLTQLFCLKRLSRQNLFTIRSTSKGLITTCHLLRLQAPQIGFLCKFLKLTDFLPGPKRSSKLVKFSWECFEDQATPWLSLLYNNRILNQWILMPDLPKE